MKRTARYFAASESAAPNARSFTLEGGNRFFRILGPADGTTFLLLGERNALFSERTQQIHALNSTAAYIWCRLEEHALPGAICRELADFGIGLDLAANHIRAALRSWMKLGLLKIDYSLDIDAFPVDRSLELSIAGFDVTVRASSKQLARLLGIFERHLTPIRSFDHVLHVIEFDGLVHVLHNRRNVACCEVVELAPSIKGYITQQIINSTPTSVAFHAACLVRDGKSLLVSGPPGAGKTTLALRMVQEEFAYGGDDVALIAPDGSATGVPFAPAIKSGAWKIVGRLHTELRDAVVHRRSDARRIRYLDPAHIAAPGSYPVGWIIFIRRAPGPATLKPLGPVESMRRMLEASYSPDGKLGVAKCHAINRALAGAATFELTFSDLTAAHDMIARLCDG